MIDWLLKYYKGEITFKETLKNRDFWFDFLIYYAIVLTLILFAFWLFYS